MDIIVGDILTFEFPFNYAHVYYLMPAKSATSFGIADVGH